MVNEILTIYRKKRDEWASLVRICFGAGESLPSQMTLHIKVKPKSLRRRTLNSNDCAKRSEILVGDYLRMMTNEVEDYVERQIRMIV